MIFIDCNTFIKADKSMNSGRIAKFLEETSRQRSFFLPSNLWDEFASWFCKNYPKELPVIIYETT